MCRSLTTGARDLGFISADFFFHEFRSLLTQLQYPGQSLQRFSVAELITNGTSYCTYLEGRTQGGLGLTPLELDILQKLITCAKEIVFACFLLVNLST